jgi:alcohol dehydrogenase YqhD (iron-dependent ADH family)
MQRFTLPRDLYHGKGALEALKTLEGKKAIVCVGGGSMKRNGFLTIYKKLEWKLNYLKVLNQIHQLKLL